MAQDESEYVSTFYWLPLNWAGNLLISGVYLEYHKCYEFDIIKLLIMTNVIYF